MGRINYQFQDHSLEYSNASARMPDLTAGNFAAQTALIDALVLAFVGVSIGTPTKDTRIASETDIVGVAPAAFAQRESKWLVRCADGVTARPCNFEIPCADLALLEAGTDRMDTGNAAYIALVAAVEALPVQSVAGNAVTVVEVIFVGRNL